MSVAVGTLVGDRYRVIGRIATGGMGEVWEAEDVVLGRPVALKLLKPELAADATARERFVAEARHAANLNHPGIAQVHDFGDGTRSSDGGGHPPYLVMELVRGRPLADWLGGGRTLPPTEAAHVIAQTADAVGFAHSRGVVHRDLKPANLLVLPDGTVKVTDFGIAKALDSAAGSGLTGTGLVLGTAGYLSPEQASGQPVTPASDLYALGVVLYEALAGRRPFEGETPVAIALAHVRDTPPPLPDSVPAGLRASVERAMAKDPADRQPDAATLAAELRGQVRPAEPATSVLPAGGMAAGTSATRAVPAPAPPPRTPWWRRPVPLALAVLALLVLLIGAAAAVNGLGDSDVPAADTTTGGSDQTTTEPQQSTTQPETTADEPATVTVAAEDYLRQEPDVAAEQLESQGLAPDEEPLDTDTVLEDETLLTQAEQVPPEQGEAVLSVVPTGALEPETTVVLGVWKVEELETEEPGNGPPETPPGQDDDDDEGGDDRVVGSRGTSGDEGTG